MKSFREETAVEEQVEPERKRCHIGTKYLKSQAWVRRARLFL